LERVKQASENGLTPLAVMQDNMTFWHEQALHLGEKLQSLVVNVDDPSQLDAAMKLLRQFLEARKNSEACAVDAAPYFHPKLASVVVKKNDENEPRRVEFVGGLDDESPTE
jgi:hypothetical protein